MHVICIKSQIFSIRKKIKIDNKVRYREKPSDLELQNFCTKQEASLQVSVASARIFTD